MATVACPSCGMPRAEELVEVTACPVCGHAHQEVAEELEPVTIEPAVPTTRGLTPRGSPPIESSRGGRLAVGLLLGFALGGASGVAGVLGWQALPTRAGDAGGTVDAVTEPDPTADRHAKVPVAPMPREVVARSTAPTTPDTPPPPAAPPVGPMPQPVPPVVPVVGGAPLQPAPANPFRPAAPAALVLDSPDAESSPVVAPGRTMVLRGRVKTLKVRGLEGGAVLDCSDLDAQEVIVTGKIDGGSTLWVKSASGNVTFQAKVDGRSRVGITAPGGTVVFANPTGGVGQGATIDGGATVDVKSKAAHFHARINGPGTKVSVTLTAGGSLLFTELEGNSRLEYGKFDPDDSEPTVVRGRVNSPAVLKKLVD